MDKNNKAVSRCYVLTRRLSKLVEMWAKEEDRSNSAVVRKLINNEAKRREETQAQKIA